MLSLTVHNVALAISTPLGSTCGLALQTSANERQKASYQMTPLQIVSRIHEAKNITLIFSSPNQYTMMIGSIVKEYLTTLNENDFFM